MYRWRKKKGQSTVEYLIILSVIIAVVVIASVGAIKPRVTNIYNRAIGRINSPNVITSNMLDLNY